MNNKNGLKNIMRKMTEEKIESIENGINGLQNKYKNKVISIHINSKN